MQDFSHQQYVSFFRQQIHFCHHQFADKTNSDLQSWASDDGCITASLPPERNVRREEIYLDVTRVQYPLAPWMAGTYNNQQGKTVRNMGHTVDFSKPDDFTKDEYTQHVYMILGRATCLEWSLFRNLPMLEDGSDIDFTVFEHGPPGYIASF